MPLPALPAPKVPRYRQLAQGYLQAIKSGTLAPGDRLPSVRSLMALHEISLSTALQICRHLENLGWVEARPRSGYFVSRRSLRGSAMTLISATEPPPTLPDPAQYVGIHERVSAIIARGRQQTVRVNLGGASGTPEFYPLDALRAAAIRQLRRNPTPFGHPVEPNGEAVLRQAWARHALTARMHVSPDEIIITHGSTEALTLALRAVAGPGDVIAVESPTYYGLLQILESLGMRALEIPTSPHTGISLEALDLAGQTYQNIKAVVVAPSLQTPLGSTMPDEHKQRLVQWCAAQGIALIEDDPYSALLEETTAAAAKSWDTSGNVIYCASLQKILAPGLRLGCIIAGKWQARVLMLKYSQSRAEEALMQTAAADFMLSGAFERHLRRLRQSLKTQRQRMAEAIDQYFPEGTRLAVPKGGLTLWLELQTTVNSEALFIAALEQGIKIAPGLMFSNSSRFDHCIRLNCGVAYTDEVERALQTLGQEAQRLLHVGS